MGPLSTKWVVCPPNGYFVHEMGTLSTEWVVCPRNGSFVHKMGPLSTKWWISMNENKQINEMISATQCFNGEDLKYNHPHKRSSRYKVNVSPHFLSPNTKYDVNLLMNFLVHYDGPHFDRPFPIKYKLDEETDFRHSFLSRERENGWGDVQLHQVTNNKQEYNFTIELDVGKVYYETAEYFFEGIEFRAILRLQNWPRTFSDSELLTQGPKLPIYTKGKLGPKYKPMGRNES
ncbi:hypothetical protein LXL04_006526 [Taraxacum kok-saghyz]